MTKPAPEAAEKKEKNVNPSTGIRYGVTQGSKSPILMEAVLENGESLTYKDWRDAKIAPLVAAIKALESKDDDESIREAAEELFDGLTFDVNFEEESYAFEDEKGNQFQLSHLGGAPIIWCIKTSVVVGVKSLCSPCVPNAGDLDSGVVTTEEGQQCYGVPEQYREPAEKKGKKA